MTLSLKLTRTVINRAESVRQKIRRRMLGIPETAAAPVDLPFKSGWEGGNKIKAERKLFSFNRADFLDIHLKN